MILETEVFEATEVDFADEVAAKTGGCHHNDFGTTSSEECLGCGDGRACLTAPQAVIDQETPIRSLVSEVLANELLVVVDFDFLGAFLALGGASCDIWLGTLPLWKNGPVFIYNEGSEATT